MTYSFQVIVNSDEDMGTVLSAIFSGLMALGREKKELQRKLEQLEELHQKSTVFTKETPLTVDTAKQLLRSQGYDVYLRKKKKQNKSKKKEMELARIEKK